MWVIDTDPKRERGEFKKLAVNNAMDDVLVLKIDGKIVVNPTAYWRGTNPGQLLFGLAVTLANLIHTLATGGARESLGTIDRVFCDYSITIARIRFVRV